MSTSNTNNNNSKYNDYGKQIKESLGKGLSTGDFSGLNEAITNSVKGAIRDAGNSIIDDFKIPGDDSWKATNASKRANNYNYANPHGNPNSSREYAEMLKAQREARIRAHQQKINVNYHSAGQSQNRSGNSNYARQNTSSSSGTALSLFEKKELNLPIKFEPVGKISGIVCAACGILGMLFSGIGALTFLLAAGVGAGFITFGAFFGGFAGLTRAGFAKRELYNRAKKYALIAGNNKYASLSTLSDALGIKAKKVAKDIKKMLNKGFFPEGYLDEEETTLMLSTDVYKQYQQTKSYAIQASAAQTAAELETKVKNKEKVIPVSAKAKAAKAKLTKEQRQELETMVAEGTDYIVKLHALNDDIPGEQISQKLDNLEMTLREIFTRVEENPEQMDRMHKLMEYYLPTMLKLVEAYKEYDQVSCPGEDILNAKNEIEKTLDTINEAFVQLLNNLFRDSVWDVTTDAQVLQTMLKQEGLAADITVDGDKLTRVSDDL